MAAVFTGARSHGSDLHHAGMPRRNWLAGKPARYVAWVVLSPLAGSPTRSPMPNFNFVKYQTRGGQDFYTLAQEFKDDPSGTTRKQ